MTGNPLLLVIVAGIMFAVLGGVTLLSHIYSLNGIKSKTVGDGQHGTARWATKAEIRRSTSTCRLIRNVGVSRQPKDRHPQAMTASRCLKASWWDVPETLLRW